MTGHHVLRYDDADELRAALADRPDGAFVVLACRPEHHALLPDGLRLPRPAVHHRPAAVLAALRRLPRHPARPLGAPIWLLAEPDVGATRADLARAAAFEAARPVTLAGEPMTTITAYPRAETPARVFAPPMPDAPVPVPDAAAALRLPPSHDRRDIVGIRARLSASLADLPILVRTDFIAAVNEVLTNAYVHGAPPVDVAVWVTRGRVECRVTDRGPGFRDPLTGYRPGPGGTRSGTGLWLARQACDEVTAWPGLDGFTVRLATAVAPGPALQTQGALARAEVAAARVRLRQSGHRRPR
ncbi:ATP-binding protein [Dactylosporangium sp. CA-139114]|uniref:ATP-binding protein n=1 Tax=Dactylosporangium sp. CA-139114 TaxID=3239931 RepID=UPI003D988AF1